VTNLRFPERVSADFLIESSEVLPLKDSQLEPWRDASFEVFFRYPHA